MYRFNKKVSFCTGLHEKERFRVSFIHQGVLINGDHCCVHTAFSVYHGVSRDV